MFLVRCEARCDEPMAVPSRLRSAAREAVASAAISELHPPRHAFVVCDSSAAPARYSEPNDRLNTQSTADVQ